MGTASGTGLLGPGRPVDVPVQEEFAAVCDMHAAFPHIAAGCPLAADCFQSALHNCHSNQGRYQPDPQGRQHPER